MGRPVAFRAAAIKGYPGEFQPLHFRTKEVQEAAWGLCSNLLPPHVRKLRLNRGASPCTQCRKHFLGRAWCQPIFKEPGSQDPPAPG